MKTKMARTFLHVWTMLNIIWPGRSMPCPGGRMIQANICLPSTYNKNTLPQESLQVYVLIDFAGVVEIDNFEQTFTVKTNLVFEWTDSNILVNERVFDEENKTDLILPENVLEEHFWKPDMYIRRLKKFEELTIVTPLRGVAVRRNKTVVLSMFAYIKIACAMEFISFPLDEQSCEFVITSTNHDKSELDFKSKLQMDYNEEQLEEYHTQVESIHYEEAWLDKVYSFTGVKVRLRRYSFPYLMQYSLPCTCLTLVGGISFIIPPTAVPGRIALLITVFLVLMTVFTAIQTVTPKSQHLTSLSGYALVCLLFIFSAMLEFAFLMLVRRLHEQKENRKKKNERSTSLMKVPSVRKHNRKSWIKEQLHSDQDDRTWPNIEDIDDFCFKVDRNSGICFLVIFFLFNIIYAIVFSI